MTGWDGWRGIGAVRAAGLAVAALAAGAPHSAHAADWAVEPSALRFEVRVAEAPTEPVAGVYVALPDGGLLPRPTPGAVVLDSAGRELASECVWFNPGEGLGLVFEPPSDGRAVIYAIPALQPARQPGRFKPGLLLYTRAGPASLESAVQMGHDSPPGRETMAGLVPAIGHMENPFGGDESYISYYTGWIRSAAPGKTYLCTISDDGSILRIDGREVASWPGTHASRAAGNKGQYGGSVDLSGGWHRIEYFHFRSDGQPEMSACWRLPTAKPGDLPVHIPASGFLHSGRAEIVALASRTGAPVAAMVARCSSYLWLGERALNLYRFELACGASQPTNAACAWRMPEGITVRERAFDWVIEGSDRKTVSLAVSNRSGASSSTRGIELATTPKKASINSGYDRLQYRNALLTRCRAVPDGQRPCAGWSPDLWLLAMSVLEPYKGRALLEELFTRSREDVLARPPEERRQLENLFFEVSRYTDKDATAKWLDRLEQDEKSESGRFYWQLARIDFTLYDRSDSNTARRLILGLQARMRDPEPMARLLIRLGDIERLSGNYAEATRLYSKAQDMPVAIVPGASAAASGISSVMVQRARFSDAWLKGVKVGGGSRSSAARRDAERDAKVPSTAAPARVDPPSALWKVEAVRGSAYYETVHELIRDGFLFEARDAMASWELELPTAKLAGDFPIAESEYFIAIRDYRRALRVLQAYRRGVDMSPFLPAAMALEFDCLVNLSRVEELRELAKLIVKRMPGHPVAQKAQDLLRVEAIADAESQVMRWRRAEEKE